MQADHIDCYVAKDEVRIRFYQWGKGDPDVLFIHGLGDGAYVWNVVIGALHGNSCVAAVDLRGHGDSDWSANGKYSIDTFLADVEGVLESRFRLGATIVGHSLGGDIAIRLAVRRPDLVRKIAILDFSPEPDPRVLNRVRDDLRMRDRKYRTRDEYASILLTQRPFLTAQEAARLSKHALDGCVEQGFTLKSDPSLSEYRRQKADAPSQEEMWTLIKSVRCENIILRGVSSSVLSAPIARRMSELLGNSRYTPISNCGHGLVTENPFAVAAALEEFQLSNWPMEAA
ncbi:MAG: alpha/beta hydrolase [Parvularculaceae bacterium]